MNIIIIHLSDLHISNKEAIHMENINALVKSINVFNSIDGVILAVSGDIAARGQNNEYKLATQFFSSIIKSISEIYNIDIKNIKLLLAPGNHDMNRQVSCQCDRTNVENWYHEKIIDENINNEFQRMGEFFDFANKNGCFTDEKKAYTRKLLHFREKDSDNIYIIEANIVNSAIFSSDNDTGIHYLPNSIFNEIKETTSALFSITVVHHSPEWYWPEQKVQLQEILYSRCNLILYGHEHYESTQRTIHNQNGISFIQSGGAWWDKSFNNSSYYIGSFNTTTREYIQYNYIWNETYKFYEQKEFINETLTYKCCDGSLLSPLPEYLKKIREDEKQPICNDFTKYYIFPKLNIETPDDYIDKNEINNEDELIDLIVKKSRIILYGSSGTGKTSILKFLFLKLSQKYTVLLCGLNEISGKIQKNIIRETFCDIYGNNPDKYAFFSQQSKKQKVILIDDVHRIKSEHLSKLLKGLGEIFEHIIIASEKVDTFDIKERISYEIDEKKDICQLKISKFFADKRRELVRKIIELCNDDKSKNIDEMEFHISNAITTQNLSYKLDPDFIVRFVSYYCRNIRELKTGQVNAFSKVFEASIELMIDPHLKKETIGQIKSALGELAYYIHFGKLYPITESDIEFIINEYKDRYDESLLSTRFLDIALASNILIRCDNNLSYRFKNNDHLAYFAAEAISRKFNEGVSGVKDDLQSIIDYSCFPINSSILKFVAYTTGNIRIVDLLIQQAISYVKNWPIYDINDDPFSFLKDIQEDYLNEISFESKKNQIKKIADHEKEQVESLGDEIEVMDLYDYNENDVYELNNQLLRAVLQMNVISSCLPTFSHMMLTSTKRTLITSLYEMPNQIFYKWAKQFDIDMIDEFIEKKDTLSSSECRKERIKILTALQRTSVNLLLNLYYTVAIQSTATSTIENLTRSQYISSINNQIELMMFYEQTDNYSKFIELSEEILKLTDNSMVKNMVTLMIYHLLVWSPTLPYDKRQYLINKYKLESKKESILLQNSKVSS